MCGIVRVTISESTVDGEGTARGGNIASGAHVSLPSGSVERAAAHGERMPHTWAKTMRKNWLSIMLRIAMMNVGFIEPSIRVTMSDVVLLAQGQSRRTKA